MLLLITLKKKKIANYKDNIKKRIRESNASILAAKQYYFDRGEYVDDFAWVDRQEFMTFQEKQRIPFEIMKMPDLMVVCKEKGSRLVEVKSGSKNHVKLKFEDLKGYRYWNRLIKVYLHIPHLAYDMVEVNYIISFDKLHQLYLKNKDTYKHDFMPDNMKAYFELPYKDIK